MVPSLHSHAKKRRMSDSTNLLLSAFPRGSAVCVCVNICVEYPSHGTVTQCLEGVAPLAALLGMRKTIGS